MIHRIAIIDYPSQVILIALRWNDPITTEFSSGNPRLEIHECARAIFGEMQFPHHDRSFESYLIEDEMAFESCINRAIYTGFEKVGLCDGALSCSVRVRDGEVEVIISDGDEFNYQLVGDLGRVGGRFFLTREWLAKQAALLGRSGWWDEILKGLLTRDF